MRFESAQNWSARVVRGSEREGEKKKIVRMKKTQLMNWGVLVEVCIELN